MNRILAVAALAAATLGVSACGLFERTKTVDIDLSSPPVSLVGGAAGLAEAGSPMFGPVFVSSSIAAVDPNDPDVVKYRKDIESVGVRSVTLRVSSIGSGNAATRVGSAILTIWLGYTPSNPGEAHRYRLDFAQPWQIQGGNPVSLGAFQAVDAGGSPINDPIDALLERILKSGQVFGVQLAADLDALPVNVLVVTNFGLAMKVKVGI